MKIGISRAAFDQILAHAAENAAEEVCGLLLGSPDTIEMALPAPNVAVDRKRMFELDPVILLHTHRAARAGGPTVLGHYHSHPEGTAKPSLHDAAFAKTGQLWLIVAKGRAALFAARREGPIQGRFVAVDYELR